MIIMVGFPGSGKSTICKRHLIPNKYAHINRDTLKTRCLKVCEEELKAGKSVVIDNTNPSKKDRAKYIDLAKKCIICL